MTIIGGIGTHDIVAGLSDTKQAVPADNQQRRMTTPELKPCPFCGKPGKLRRVLSGYRINPTVIMDKWTVICPNDCCQINGFDSEIFQDNDGKLIVKHNGAEEAIEAWNRRAENA